MKNLFVFILTLTLITPTLAATVAPKPAGKVAPLPDLEVVKLIATPLKNGKVRVLYTIKNSGHAKSGPSVTRVTISTAGIKEVRQNTPELKPGDLFTNSVEYALGKNGKYLFNVSADYLKQVTESNERNNNKTIRFGISRTI